MMLVFRVSILLKTYFYPFKKLSLFPLSPPITSPPPQIIFSSKVLAIYFEGNISGLLRRKKSGRPDRG